MKNFIRENQFKFRGEFAELKAVLDEIVNKNNFTYSGEIKEGNEVIITFKRGSEIALRLLGFLCSESKTPLKLTFRIKEISPNEFSIRIYVESDMTNIGSSYGLKGKFKKVFDSVWNHIYSIILNKFEFVLSDENIELNKEENSIEVSRGENLIMDFRWRGFLVVFILIFTLTFSVLKSGFTGSWGTNFFMLTLISVILGVLFGLVGLSIGKNIKSDSPLSDQEIISSFFKSPRNKYFYSTIILFFILLYFFGRQTNPFISNGICIDDLRNDEECIQYLQGQWYFRKGGRYSGDEYKVTVEGEKINFKCKYSGEDDWRTMGEGEIGFDEVVENYWCCTRSVRCIHINGSSSFLFLTQSVNNGDQCGGFAFDGYSGKDIVGDEDFFVKVE